MAVSNAWRRALTLAPGSARLIITRWLIWIAVVLPGSFAGYGMLAQGPAAEPYFSDAPQPLPLGQLVEMLGRAGPLFGLAFAGAAAAWLASQLLTAGAIVVFRAEGEQPVHVRHAVLHSGMHCLLRYLRIALLAAIWLAVFFTLTGRLFDRLADHGELAGWSALTGVELTITRALLLVLLASAVGACALWCRVIVTTSERRCVRRLHQVVPKIVLRAPLQGLILPVAVSAFSLVVGATLIFAWRQAGAGNTALWLGLWLVVTLGQAYLWHFRVRLFCELTRVGIASAWVMVPDTPWHVFRRLWRFVRRPLTRPITRSPADA